MHPIRRLQELGQSVWLDYIESHMIASGELDRMIADDGLMGLTSNPTIFQKAIASSSYYDEFIAGAPTSEDDASVFERIQVRDVAMACDRFRSVFDETDGADGYVSIEVAPRVAKDTMGSIDEAMRLWSAVARPNLMVKIPGTREGLRAIEHCLVEGINVNVTLLFSVSRYLEVCEVFLRALEARVRRGQSIGEIASVASFFVSRVDTKVDKLLDGSPDADAARGLRGQTAIANARWAYERWERAMASDRWRLLESKGARPQRLLWASTSSKDPLYPDTYYVDALVAPHTVDTMPLETFRAYLEHGAPGNLLNDEQEAREPFHDLANLGINLGRVTEALENEGVALFQSSFEKAVSTIAGKRRLLRKSA